MRPNVLYLVDDRKNEAEEYSELLGAQSDSIIIRILHPPERKEDVGTIVSGPETAGFIIDQQLEEAVHYDGTDLAAYIRSLRKEIPVFMLTGYGSDVEANENSDAVDNVFPKDIVVKQAKSLMRRMERRIGFYDEALSSKARRMTELIDLSISGDITETEATELLSLQRDLERPQDNYLSNRASSDETIIEMETRLVERLEKLVDRLTPGKSE